MDVRARHRFAPTGYFTNAHCRGSVSHVTRRASTLCRKAVELAYWSLRFGGPVHELGRMNSPQALSYPNPAYGGYAPMEALAELYTVLGQPERCRDILGFDSAFTAPPGAAPGLQWGR
jgi:hypothetical protein